MKKLLVGFLAIVGGLSILAVMALAGLGLLSALAKPGVPSRVMLEVDFEHGLIEAIPDDPVARLMLEGYLDVRDVVDALDKASGDRRVQGLVARVGGTGMGLAHIQEIRDAVQRFRSAGKPAVAFAETFGEFGPGNGGYYLATAFDEIYMQPSGFVGLTGLIYESMFVKGALDKLDIEPRIDQRYEYKNAANTYNETEYTEAHREAMQAVVDSQFEQMLEGIADARGMSVSEVRVLFDGGPFLGDEAVEAGLVDRLAYRDEVYEQMREKSDRRAKPLFLSAYLERAGRPNSRGTTVALIHGYGTIMRGASQYSPLDGTVVMGSDTIAAAFRSAIEDRRVRAIVFRVDSPGGSPVASHTIWRETVRAREAGKPVIVSMGNLAGSGGYEVAMSADKIVAQPGTITGSIGVLGGKMITRGFWDKVGVSWDDVHTSTNSTMWSSVHDWNATGYARFQEILDATYDDFTQRVALGRDLPLEQVLEVARGRIWTGKDALELGLVDELGGFDVALRLVREAAGLDDDAPLRLKRFPASRTAFEMIFGPKADHSATTATLVRALRSVQPTVRVLERIVLGDDARGLGLPEALQQVP